MMNLKEYGRNGSGIMKYSVGIFLQELKKTTTNLRIAGIRDSSRYLPNTSLANVNRAFLV